ncbi:DUF2683 family protein [Candidatus Woesearchaeota archaeon]|nr:DUF2683 family protein [Candidatus Woesearchaeota archaeon]
MVLMAQMIVHVGQHQDRILTIVKGKYGLRNKSDAVNFVIKKYEDELLEPMLRPEYIEKIKNIEKNGKFKMYSSLDKLRAEIEYA